MASSSSSSEALIPGLPNDIAATILSSLPIPHQSRLLPTSRSWRSFLLSPSPFHLRRRLRLRSHLLCLFPSDPSLSPPLLFDPLALSWSPLPPLPVSPHVFSLSNFTSVFLSPHLYILGGSHFDARSYPLNHPLPSSSAFRLPLFPPRPLSWARIPDMPSPRGSSACAAHEPSRTILVAGGGSRHLMYPSEGSRVGSVEVLDAETGEWRESEGMGRRRAGCVGFLKGEEFWVMGGYGEYRTVGGVVPRDVYCRDAVAMGLRSGKWREVGDMWEEGERRRLGKVAVIQGDDDHDVGVFMLERKEIFRYDFASNRWLKETSLCKKILSDESCCFVAMNDELYVLTAEPRRSPRKRMTLEIQVYNPNQRKWKFMTTTTPFICQIDFKTAISCTILL